MIDTNVLIQNPRALDCFEDNQVVLPMVVLEELDKLKQAEGEKGANARSAIRFLEQTRHRGDLLEGVPLENGGVLRVEKNFVDVALPPDMPDHLMDNRILKVCKGLAEENGGAGGAGDQGYPAAGEGADHRDPGGGFHHRTAPGREEQYRGRAEVYAPEELFKEFKKKGIPVSEVYQTDEEGKRLAPELYENEFVVIRADQSVGKTHLGRVENGRLRKLEYKKSSPYGVTPRNSGQYFSRRR